ncbi:hypothetical protein BKA16_001940 [Gordonia humi]|uniref:Uncharacterized protein n=1 Tax=Gordonia humi TaxID=686429 RepID=A0A840EYJ0_9ACTN|nr:hypothetical protein [Gordonia humi]MBB4135388.1 hypothetical protein [Gordonia humi]
MAVRAEDNQVFGRVKNLVRDVQRHYVMDMGVSRAEAAVLLVKVESTRFAGEAAAFAHRFVNFPLPKLWIAFAKRRDSTLNSSFNGGCRTMFGNLVKVDGSVFPNVGVDR